MSGVQAGLCDRCGAAVGADRVCSVCSSPDDVVVRAKSALGGGWWSPADLSELIAEVERLRAVLADVTAQR